MLSLQATQKPARATAISPPLPPPTLPPRSIKALSPPPLLWRSVLRVSFANERHSCDIIYFPAELNWSRIIGERKEKKEAENAEKATIGGNLMMRHRLLTWGAMTSSEYFPHTSLVGIVNQLTGTTFVIYLRLHKLQFKSNFSNTASSTELAYKVGPGLRESRLLAPSGH